MKNNKEYSKKIRQLYRQLKHSLPGTEKPTYDEPLDSLVYAIVSENTSLSEARSATRRVSEHFADLNDLRVSKADELIEVLGFNAAAAKQAASAISVLLSAVFQSSNSVSLKGLKQTGKRQARKKLEQLEGLSNFAVNYCVLTALQGHAVPITKKMVNYLRTNNLVHPEADEKEIEGFLAKQIRAEKTYEFYALLRRAAEAGHDISKLKKKEDKKAETKKQTKKKKTKTKRTKKG